MSAKKKSSRRSDTSASPRDAPSLFIDRNAWSRVLGKALADAGIPYVAHHREFAGDAPDEDWISAVSRERWIAVTRDQNIRRKPNELAAIRASRAIIFVFTSGNLSAEDTASLLVRAHPRILHAARAAKRPALFSIRTDGSIGTLAL